MFPGVTSLALVSACCQHLSYLCRLIARVSLVDLLVSGLFLLSVLAVDEDIVLTAAGCIGVCSISQEILFCDCSTPPCRCVFSPYRQILFFTPVLYRA